MCGVFFPPPQSHWDFHGTHQRIWGRVHAGLQAYKRGKKWGWGGGKWTDWDLEWIYLDILHVAGSQAFLDHSSLGISNKPISAPLLKQAGAGTENAPRSHQIGLLGSKSVGKDEQDQIKKLNFPSLLLGRQKSLSVHPATGQVRSPNRCVWDVISYVISWTSRPARCSPRVKFFPLTKNSWMTTRAKPSSLSKACNPLLFQKWIHLSWH